MSVVWVGHFAFLKMWAEFGALGTMICPGCAAALPATGAGVVRDGDGRWWHLQCLHVCTACGGRKRRHDRTGRFICFGDQCRTAAAWWSRFSAQIEYVAEQYWTDCTAKAKAELPPGGYVYASRYAKYRRQEDEDAKLVRDAMAASVRYAPDPEAEKLVRAWQRRWHGSIHAVAYRYLIDCEEAKRTWPLFCKALGEIARENIKNRRRWRRFGVEWYRLYRRISKERGRLMNPNYDHLDDPAERRFAQLEID